MRTKKIISIIALAVIMGGLYIASSERNRTSYDISLSQLEALADDESGTISIRICYKKEDINQVSSSPYDVTVCSSSTTSSEISNCSGKIPGKKKFGVSDDLRCIRN